MKEILKNIEKIILNNRQRVLYLILSLLVIVLSLTVSYAFFTGVVSNNKAQGVDLVSGTLKLRFADDDEGISEVLDFGESVTKKLLIENLGTLDAIVDLYWDDLVNTYLNKSLTYKLEYKTSIDSSEYTNVPLVSPRVPTSEFPTSKILANGLEIPASTTHYYNLTITLEYLDDVDQIEDLDARFSTFFELKEGIRAEPNTIRAVSSSYYNRMWKHKADINKIVFEGFMNAPATYAYSYDISHDEDSSIMAYLVTDEIDNTKFIAYIQADGKIFANRNSAYLFRGFNSLQAIEGLDIFDTSKATDMHSMFNNCYSLTSLDLSNFNTSKVIDMRSMFYNCHSLTKLDLSYFDMSNVTNMSNMFQECYGLTTLNLNNFNTPNVVDMSYMFYNCNSLTTLDLGSFNTGKVIDMHGLFHRCSSLTSVNVSSFDTSSATDIHGMFYNCSSLTALDLNNFNTSNVTNMGSMFQNCTSLENLNVSNFDTSKVIDMHNMFYLCSSLSNLNLSNFNTSNVTTMYNMFYDCSNLTSLNVSNFDTSKVTDMHNMFRSCSSLTALDVSGFNTGEVANMSGMFRRCDHLIMLDLSSFDTSKVTNMQEMFYKNRSLTTINLSNWSVVSLTNYIDMLIDIPSSIMITVNSAAMQTWLIDISTTPKLTSSNFIVNL